MSKTADDINIWYRRLGHLNYRTLKKMANRNGSTGLKLEGKVITCSTCPQAKSTKSRMARKKEVLKSLLVVFDESQSYKSAEDNILDPVELTFNFNDTDSDDETGIPVRSNDLAIPDPMQRLHLLSDAKGFCEINDIEYNPSEFNFKTKYVLRPILPGLSGELPGVSKDFPAAQAIPEPENDVKEDPSPGAEEA
ncbi:hypothetical protein CHUAL_009890 [Chamberlinius hualienensis]